MAVELIKFAVLECLSSLVPLIEISDQLCRHDRSNRPAPSPSKQLAKWTRVIRARHLPVVAHEMREFTQIFMKHIPPPETKPSILFVHVRGTNLQTVGEVWLLGISIHFNSVVIKVCAPEILINHTFELPKPFTRHKIYRHRLNHPQKKLAKHAEHKLINRRTKIMGK